MSRFDGFYDAPMKIQEVIRIANNAGIPLIIDAAARLPPVYVIYLSLCWVNWKPLDTVLPSSMPLDTVLPSSMRLNVMVV